MTSIVEFPLEGGGSVLVAASADSIGGPVTRGMGGDVLQKAEHSFQDAVRLVQPVAESIVTKIRAIEDPPDEVHVEFGLDLHAEAGAFIAAASSGATITVSMTWRRATGD